MEQPIFISRHLDIACMTFVLPFQETVRGGPVPDLVSWHTGRKMKEPKVVDGTPIEHYGRTTEDMRAYCEEFQRRNGPDADPMQAPIDAATVLLAGEGKKHGRYRILDSLVQTTATYPQVRATLSSGSATTTSRATSRVNMSATVSFFSFVPILCLSFLHNYASDINYVIL